MDWHITDAQSLAIIDRQVDSHNLSPAEYEIARRVIYSTADFEYASILGFSPESLTKGAAALASRTSILVDVPMIQVNIVPILQKTFGNPVYCCSTAVTRPQQRKTKAAWGLEALAKSHSEAIFVIGQDQTLLSTLVELYNRNAIQPALVIVTPPTFVEQNTKKWLNNSSIPHIYVNGSKGSATVAAAILNSLVELTWIAYQLQPQSIA